MQSPLSQCDNAIMIHKTSTPKDPRKQSSYLQCQENGFLCSKLLIKEVFPLRNLSRSRDERKKQSKTNIFLRGNIFFC